MHSSPVSVRRISGLGLRLLAAVLLFTMMHGLARAQASGAESQDADDSVVAFDPEHATPAQAADRAWTILTTAASDKRAEWRIQALAALGTMTDAKSTGMIAKAMDDPDLDVRTAAILAAGQGKQILLRGKMHALLDDKDPQVAFAAATTLWKMKDYAGEDILMAVASGDRSANATFKNGTMHTMNKDFHNPSLLAKMGAMQGASMLLGPFGFGIGAYEAIRKNGGNSARVTAIEQLADDWTDPVRAELLSALDDKDATVRAAAAKALGTYHESDVAQGLAKAMIDPKAPVRFTAAAAYLRSASNNATQTTGKRR